jgi:hypothetical protein
MKRWDSLKAGVNALINWPHWLAGFNISTQFVMRKVFALRDKPIWGIGI